MSSHIQKSCAGLEATLSDSKKKYGDKVNALLSAWEHVTNFIPGATPDATQSLIEWVHKHTLKLVLRGEWPKLSPATKTHLSVTLQRCASHLLQHPAAATKCTALITLVRNPWKHPTLDSILNGQPDSENEEEFCCSEKGELLTMRLKILCEDRCEDIAVNLAAACLRSLRRSDRLRTLSDTHHLHYMVDVYIVLLYKLKRTQDIFAQLKLMDLNDGLELVQRLSGEKPTKYGIARVWRNSIKAAELVAQYLVTAGMVRPVFETGANTLEQILNSWTLLHSKFKEVSPSLGGIIRKLIEPAESAQHIYIFCAVLAKHFGDNVRPLLIELYIRALTTDMNELESHKGKSDKEKVSETAKRLSAQFLKLADVVVNNIGIARECVLTAFSLHPTRICYDRIKEIAIACGKLEDNSSTSENQSDNNKIENISQNGNSDTIIRPSEKVEEKIEPNTSSGSSTLTSPNPIINGLLAKKDVELPNHHKQQTFDCADQLFQNLLANTKRNESTAATVKSVGCPLHPKREPSIEGPLGELCFNCGEFTGIDNPRTTSIETNIGGSMRNVERTLDALILIKGDAVTGSSNYDEQSVPNQVLDGEKLGLSPQLCDDLAVVLSSPRYHMLSWVLEWKELKNLCEKYLENAEEMRNTTKELKYLNIDYSQFKDWPSEDDTKDIFFGIEKGYEQWADVPSDNSEQFGSFQPARSFKRSSTRRSIDDTTSDSDSGSVLRIRRTGRARKTHRLESSESDYDSEESKVKPFRNRVSSISDDSDSNTQDSQTDSLGSDGFRLKMKKKNNTGKVVDTKRAKSNKLTVESVSHFHMLINDNARHPNPLEDASGSDVSSNDIITLFSADLDENKRETIKGSTYTAAAPLIITEKRSDPAVLKSLRMFRPQNAKKPTRMSQILQQNLLNKNNKIHKIEDSSKITKFAPMLSTLNLNPKIILTRTQTGNDGQGNDDNNNGNDIGNTGGGSRDNENATDNGNIRNGDHVSPCGNDNKNIFHSKKPQRRGTNNNNNHHNHHHHHHHHMNIMKKNISKNSKTDKDFDSIDILAKNVPGLNSLDMMVPPRIRSTVNVVQLSRNIPQSPNSGSMNSGNTPLRPNRISTISSNVQLPTSGMHESGPAGQTPQQRSSALPDIGEEASQPLDNSPTGSNMTNSSLHQETDLNTRTMMIRRSNQSNHMIKKSQSSNTMTTTTTTTTTTSTTIITTASTTSGITSTTLTADQLQFVCKPDGTYQLASINTNPVSGQREVIALQNLSEHNLTTMRAQRGRDNVDGSNRTTYEKITTVKTPLQSVSNPGLPKFQQAFGKTIYTLSTETGTAGVVATTTETLATQPVIVQKTTNLSKAVQTSVPNTQATNSLTGINVQSIANIPNLQLSANRQILNIVQSSSSNTNVITSSSTNQALTQLVQNVQNASPGVIYTHKIPVTISTTNPSQLNIIPTISHTNSLPAGRTPVVKFNIIRTATPLRPPNIAGAIQAVLTTPPRLQQPIRTSENLIATSIETPNQVSSTTLEQLREFESVLEQVKERSTIQPQSHADTSTVQTQTTIQITQTNKSPQPKAINVIGQATNLTSTQTSTSDEFCTNSHPVTFHQEIFPQKVSLTYVPAVSGTPKVSNSTPLVVVTSYCQPAASPALSVTSQSSSSPCVTPAPASISSAVKTSPTPPPSKSLKKSVSKTVKTSATNTSKASPIPKPQQKPQEDEQTAQRIYAILDEYAEQLRNSPDLNNKPAPRRRSNPPTNPSQSSKRKKSSTGKSKPAGQQNSELSPGNEDLGRTMGSEDSSSGIVQVQDSPAGFSTPDEPSANASTMAEAHAELRNLTNDSNDSIELDVKRRNLIISDSNSGQSRAVIVQEAIQTNSVNVSEALASVTGKMASTAVLVQGTNYILPMNLMKGGQQFTIVSGGSKLLATVPATVRTSGAAGVSNALVLQSFLNQSGKIISQPAQVKSVKLPTLQTLSNNQTSTSTSTQSTSVVIPHQSNNNQMVEDLSTGDKINAMNDTTIKSENTSNAIIVNKPTATVGILQRNLSELTDNQQICGVITSNANLGFQGTRFFNSSMHKITTPTTLKAEDVMCLTSNASLSSQEKKLNDDQVGNDKSVPIQTTSTTIALAFTTSQSDVSVISDGQQHKRIIKGNFSEIVSNDKVISPKTVKRKIDETVNVVENIPKALITSDTVVASNIVATLRNNVKIEPGRAISVIGKQATSTDNSSQYLGSAESSNSDGRSSSTQQSSETINTSSKVGNGLLCVSTRLQENWDSERKPSPDTPWRYVPTTGNALNVEPMKVYSRESDIPENVQNVLQIINKTQSIEMNSNQIFQTTGTKKYLINHTLEPFQHYQNKTNIVKSQTNLKLERELLQQRIERKAAAMERELKLQKSLSEECEDLGVGEPSTSDLFPEAELFDTNPSPSFDHSSQDASCSSLPGGIKSYNSVTFRPLDSSSGSRDASPVTDFKLNDRRRIINQKTRTIKDNSKKTKRGKHDEIHEIPSKHMRLNLDNLSQEEASNSNSDVSRLSPVNFPLLENDNSKGGMNHNKLDLRNDSNQDSPSSMSSIPSNIKSDIDIDSESLPPRSNVNNQSAISSGDESSTLMSGTNADVTVPSPFSPIAGPLLSSHKYTYSNKKRLTSKTSRSNYLAWESPVSEQTKSSSDEEESSISESVSSYPEENSLTNGLDDNSKSLTSLSPDRRYTYLKKNDKPNMNPKVVLNVADHKAFVKRIKVTDSISGSIVVGGDKASELSDDETGHIAMIEPDCKARRSSLRGHVKKGCACCNGSPERPKKKSIKPEQKLKKKLISKHIGKKR